MSTAAASTPSPPGMVKVVRGGAKHIVPLAECGTVSGLRAAVSEATGVEQSALALLARAGRRLDRRLRTGRC
jgi:hypothetical protein